MFIYLFTDDKTNHCKIASGLVRKSNRALIRVFTVSLMESSFSSVLVPAETENAESAPPLSPQNEPDDSKQAVAKKPRHRHTPFQLTELNKLYEVNSNPPLQERLELAEKLGMSVALQQFVFIYPMILFH